MYEDDRRESIVKGGCSEWLEGDWGLREGEAGISAGMSLFYRGGN